MEKAGGSSPPVGSKFNKTVSLHLLRDFLSQKCGKEMLFRTGFVSQLCVAGHSDRNHLHLSGGHRRRRSVGPKRRPGGGRTGQDREGPGVKKSKHAIQMKPGPLIARKGYLLARQGVRVHRGPTIYSTTRTAARADGSLGWGHRVASKSSRSDRNIHCFHC